MKHLFLLPLFFIAAPATAQLSIYDGFDDNSNAWIVFTDDTATFDVANSKLDMSIRFPGHYINAKGAPFNAERAFRVETSALFVAGADSLRYGICWGASDVENFFSFYITSAGKFGFGAVEKGKWRELVRPESSPFINKKGTNWLRVNTTNDAGGRRILVLCINEVAVKTMDYVQPPGLFFGTYVGGAGNIRFDDFILYQRGAQQEEFEPADLGLSLACRSGELRYVSAKQSWSCCVEQGCRVDEDSVVTRFWHVDSRAGDYSILVVPMYSLGSVGFAKAADQDFRNYMALGDSIISVRKEPITTTVMGNETKVYQIGEVYTANDLAGNLYIRRYYIDHPNGENSGLVIQFIVPENSPYVAVLDKLVRQVAGTMEFR